MYRASLASRSASLSAVRARPAAALVPVRAQPVRARRTVAVRASQEPMNTEELTAKAKATVEDLQAKWEATEEKPAAVALTVAGFIGVWAASGVVSAVDKLPIIGDFFELVGLLVTGWFIYRYLLFGPDRAELKSNIDSFLDKVSGK
eukprot:CAMPEP_0177772938 /NCGR_PEP_ID=MMETSP0491_2-20121128/12549_1 /TAXON_ID=63592 /ORGANISM="Tetraselmis chuii, Strain PLY429" /LENGTH=146 /DNA_ID=CAMNT_0019290901 /DNA_START=199 /DNA_END=639 /DNA_ORIENTATION=+